jgi:diaminopimelate epimerase
MDINFYKASAAGNDFVLIDNRKKIIAQSDYQKLAHKICARKLSVGADGLLIVESNKACDFRMKYFNSDGSHATMCGNGARAIARFAFVSGIVKNKVMFFETDAGVVNAEILDDVNVNIKLFDPTNLQRNIKLDIDGKNYNVDFINTGVPHAVLIVDDIEDVPVVKLGRAIRMHKKFAPDGTNVDFVQKKKDSIYVRTYERGVEDETLACGTGIIASAIISVLKDITLTPVKVISRGGDELEVSFKQDHPHIHSVNLKGPAIITFRGLASL